MSDPKSPQKGTVEVLRFLQTLWGFLSGLSILFPGATLLLDAIPVASAASQSEGPQGLYLLPPRFVAAIATAFAFFMFLQTIGRRDAFKHGETVEMLKDVDVGVGVRAGMWFIASLFFVYMYLRLYFTGVPDVARSALLSHDWFLVLYYSLFFASLTRSFTMLGVREYNTSYAANPGQEPRA